MMPEISSPWQKSLSENQALDDVAPDDDVRNHGDQMQSRQHNQLHLKLSMTIAKV